MSDVDRRRRRGSLATAASLALAGIGVVEAVRGRGALPWLVLAALPVPAALQARRGRLGPVESFVRWVGRRGVRIRPGWETGVGSDEGSVVLTVKGRVELHGWACEVHGPTGEFAAEDPEPADAAAAGREAQRTAVLRFPADFADEAGEPLPPLDRLARGPYHALWWGWDGEGRRHCVGHARFRLPRGPR